MLHTPSKRTMGLLSVAKYSAGVFTFACKSAASARVTTFRGLERDLWRAAVARNDRTGELFETRAVTGLEAKIFSEKQVKLCDEAMLNTQQLLNNKILRHRYILS